VDPSPLRGRRVFITGDPATTLAVRLEVNEVLFQLPFQRPSKVACSVQFEF
jgi:hypothetical protein